MTNKNTQKKNLNRQPSSTHKARGKEPDTWYKLDLSAIVYPTLQRRDFSSVYRLSVVLKEPVDPEILQKAVDLAMPRFPTYKTAIHKGLFWRYLEPNNRPGPFVQKDIRNFCMPMPFKAGNGYLLRIYYYGCRISLEAHHCLGDGSGGMCVLQTITAVYLRLLGHKISNGYFVMDIDQPPHPEELEDAYMRYANASVSPARPGSKTYRVRGTREPFYTFNVIDGIMSVREVASVASSYHATITEYLNAVLLYSLLEKQFSEQAPHKRAGFAAAGSLRPVRIAMPVNLRRFFPSRTLRNFITMVYPVIDPRLGDYSFEDIVLQVHNYMQYYINEKFLRGDITTNANTQRNPFIRVVPLFIKDFVVRQFYTRVQDKNSSAGLTNMGAMKVPDDMKPYLSRFDIYMGQPFSSRTNCAIISFEDTLTINFASSIMESDVERYFFQKLVKDGIHVTIESNRRDQ